MRKDKQNFIGKLVVVNDAKNTTYKGVKGVIVEETKESFLIQNDQETKRILKRGTTFTINDEPINGESIIKQSQERIKTK